MDGLSKTTNGRNIQNRSVAFLEDVLDTNFCVISFERRSSALYEHILRTSAKSIWHATFSSILSSSCNLLLTSFGTPSFLYELLLTIFCPIQSSSHELLLTNNWYTIFFFTNFYLRFYAVRAFAPHDHFLTNFWHTNIRHTNFCPVTVRAQVKVSRLLASMTLLAADGNNEEITR